MADSVEISSVDENDFVKEGKLYFLSESSQWEIALPLILLKIKTTYKTENLSIYIYIFYFVAFDLVSLTEVLLRFFVFFDA